VPAAQIPNMDCVVVGSRTGDRCVHAQTLCVDNVGLDTGIEACGSVVKNGGTVGRCAYERAKTPCVGESVHVNDGLRVQTSPKIEGRFESVGIGMGAGAHDVARVRVHDNLRIHESMRLHDSVRFGDESLQRVCGSLRVHDGFQNNGSVTRPESLSTRNTLAVRDSPEANHGRRSSGDLSVLGSSQVHDGVRTAVSPQAYAAKMFDMYCDSDTRHWSESAWRIDNRINIITHFAYYVTLCSPSFSCVCFSCIHYISMVHAKPAENVGLHVAGILHARHALHDAR
jgi:hypothetical protein